MLEILLKEVLSSVKGKVKFEKIKENLIKILELKIAGENNRNLKIKYPLEWKILNDEELKIKPTQYDVLYDNDPTYNKKLEFKIREIKSGVYDEHIRFNYREFID